MFVPTVSREAGTIEARTEVEVGTREGFRAWCTSIERIVVSKVVNFYIQICPL